MLGNTTSRGVPSGLGGRDGPVRVLVAEDHPDLSRLFTSMLRRRAFDAIAVLDGLQVYLTACSFRPHFILLDIGLPGLDGFSVAEMIRKNDDLSGIRIIGITAFGRDPSMGRGRFDQFDHFFTKPVDFEEILPLLTPPPNVR